MKIQKWVARFVMSVIAPLASAAGETGLYGAIDVGQSKAKGYCDLSAAEYVAMGVTSLSCGDTATGYRITLGYQADKHFSGEAGYFSAGKVSTNLTGDYSSVPSVPYTSVVSTKVSAWQFAAIGSWPVADRFSVFGKVGMSFWDVLSSMNISTASVTAPGNGGATGTDFLWGLGGKYDIDNAVGIRAQYESSKAGKEDTTGRGSVDFLSVGLVYKF